MSPLCLVETAIVGLALGMFAFATWRGSKTTCHDECLVELLEAHTRAIHLMQIKLSVATGEMAPEEAMRYLSGIEVERILERVKRP